MSRDGQGKLVKSPLRKVFITNYLRGNEKDEEYTMHHEG